ncbi:hypothetical protein DPMN_113079 [Dreissena polymorpha]|uniref:G-protein coupled receptors family 1 profile domain-containing protein n=1 Tax=Dreissena polymorpha TaxID=45954 RepID=A0A9D4KGU4_DREPO|nr:hypothetical protein DPMN_113079 [Dreissena polymorpha]
MAMEQANVSDQTRNTSLDRIENEGSSDVSFVFSTLCTTFSMLILLCDVAAVIILSQCKRIPYQCRYLSLNFIVSDGISCLSFLICQILIFRNGTASTFMANIRVVSVGASLIINMLSVACLSAERAFVLLANLAYSRIVTRCRVVIVAASAWVLVCITVPSITVYGFEGTCNGHLHGCDLWEATRPARLYMMSLVLLAEVCVVCSYFIIHRIAMRHMRAIAALRSSFVNASMNKVGNMSGRQFSTTKAIVKIVLVFIVLHSFIVIHLIVHETSFENRNTPARIFFYAFAYLCIQANSFLSLRLYFATFKECKLKLYVILSKIYPAFEVKTEELRRDVYNIVVTTELSPNRQPFAVATDLNVYGCMSYERQNNVYAADKYVEELA